MSETKTEKTEKYREPSKKELLERARKNRSTRLGVPIGRVANAEEGWHYYRLHVRGRNQKNLEVERKRLSNAGYIPVNGPWYKGPERSEFDPRNPDVEIWRCPQEVKDDDQRARQARALDPNECPHWLEIQAGRTQRGALVPPWAKAEFAKRAARGGGRHPKEE